MNLFQKLRDGLSKTRQGIERNFTKLFSRPRTIDPELMESIEEILIGADLGAVTTGRVIQRLEARLREDYSRDTIELPELKNYLKQELLSLFKGVDQAIEPMTPPYVILFVGVNGVGKTTTIGKLGAKFKRDGRTVLFAAADTFRAAAIEQLSLWAKRTGFSVVAQSEGSDPSAVVFDAVQAAKARSVDILMVDTAGRLHTKLNLMEELKKIRRVAEKALPGSPHQVLLVLDSTTGQNALQQVRMFHQAVGITGIVMTKLDGTARGGTLITIVEEHKIPIRYVGVGEGLDDLLEFNAEAFVDGFFA